MSLTDDIYRELLDGLEKGHLDWQQFLTKHSGSKGPLYNAIRRFFVEGGAKIATLCEEKNRVQSELDQAELKLDSLDQKTKEGESNIVSLEERQNVLNGQVTTLEAKLAEKSELVQHLAHLEKLGFDSEKLKQLQEALREIGAKHGVKGKEAVGKFFDDLKDYEAVLGAELQLTGLQTQLETKKLEVENWQAKEETLKRKHDNSKEAIEAVHTLLAKGIKVIQIITWHQILNRFETVEQFAKSLAQYDDVTKLLKARRTEAENWESRLAKAQGEVKTLEKERDRIEGAIDALRVAGVNQLKTMTAEATNQLKAVVGNLLTQIDASAKKAFQIGEEVGKARRELQKYDPVRQALESHADAEEQ